MTDQTPQTLLSRRMLQKHLQKLHINNGDVLLLREGTPAAREDVIMGIVRALGELGHKEKCLVVVVNRFDDLAVLDEKEMNKHGWYYLPQLKKLIHTKTDSEESHDDDIQKEIDNID